MKKLLLAVSFLAALTLPSLSLDTGLLKQINRTNINLNGTCSGTIINAEKKIAITAAHCLSGHIVFDPKTKKEIERKPVVMTITEYGPDGKKTFQMSTIGKIVKYSEAMDIALVQMDNDNIVLKTETKLATSVTVGEDVICVGLPFGMITNFVSKGSVARLNVSDDIKGLPQGNFMMTCPVSGGMSGGAVLNDKGELLGVIQTTLAMSNGFPATGWATAGNATTIAKWVSE